MDGRQIRATPPTVAPPDPSDQASRVLASALALPDTDRAAVTAALLESLAPPDRWGEDDPALADELVRRLERVDRGEAVALDGDEVEREVRASLRRR
jgi:Putative addiction module component